VASPSPVAAELRRLLLRLVLGTAVVHAVAIAVYYAADMGTRSSTVRGVYTVAWVAATFVVVSVYLRRIRLARRGLAVRGRR
jgi:hypothetical protein